MCAVVGVRVAVRVDRVEQGLGKHPGVAHAVRVERPQRHDLRAWRHHRDQPGDVGAVAVRGIRGAAGFGRVGVVVNEVEAGQQPAGEQGVAAVDAGVDDGDANAAAGGERVRLGQAHGLRRPLRGVGLRRADRPGHVLARLGAALGRIRLGDHHAGFQRQRSDKVLHTGRADHLQAVDRPRPEAAHQGQRVPDQQRLQGVAAAQFDQHLAGHFGVGARPVAAAAAGGRGAATPCASGARRAATGLGWRAEAQGQAHSDEPGRGGSSRGEGRRDHDSASWWGGTAYRQLVSSFDTSTERARPGLIRAPSRVYEKNLETNSPRLGLLHRRCAHQPAYKTKAAQQYGCGCSRRIAICASCSALAAPWPRTSAA